MPKQSKCQGYDIFQRMNYLFQIRDFMAINIKNPMTSAHYGNLIVNIAKKSVMRMDPHLKRQICKKCRGALLPGLTADIKIKRKKKNTTVLWTCSQCKFKKRFPIVVGKPPWFENPESIVERIEYGKKNHSCENKQANAT